MKTLLHKIEHLFGWNAGRIESWYDIDGRLMIGFRCITCGKYSGVHQSYTQRRKY